MYILIAGGGKIGANLARSLLRDGHGHEVTLIEQRRDRYEHLEHEFEHQVQLGDATEIHVLERAGIARPPDVVVAVTGDDEDNIVICQMAREKYGVSKVVARVNDPRNQTHFDLLGISATVSATVSIMALIEHEVPEHEAAAPVFAEPRQRLFLLVDGGYFPALVGEPNRHVRPHSAAADHQSSHRLRIPPPARIPVPLLPRGRLAEMRLRAPRTAPS